MMNTNARTELTDKELYMVAGGDYGDADRDNGRNPMYSVGQDVEVYISSLHIFTGRHRIKSSELYTTLLGDETYWIYTTDDGQKVTANHIQG